MRLSRGGCPVGQAPSVNFRCELMLLIAFAAYHKSFWPSGSARPQKLRSGATSAVVLSLYLVQDKARLNSERHLFQTKSKMFNLLSLWCHVAMMISSILNVRDARAYDRCKVSADQDTRCSIAPNIASNIVPPFSALLLLLLLIILLCGTINPADARCKLYCRQTVRQASSVFSGMPLIFSCFIFFL